MRRNCFVNIVVAVFAAITLIGCTTPEQKAQEIFNQGKYEEVIARYPDLPVADQAREKLAELLFQAKDYPGVLKQYPDSPFAAQARDSLAQVIFDQGKLNELIVQYPESPIATRAKEKLAADLLAQALPEKDLAKQRQILSLIIANYPNTQGAAEAQQLLMQPPDPQETKGASGKSSARR